MKVKLEEMVNLSDLFYNSRLILLNKLSAGQHGNGHFDLTPFSSDTKVLTTTTLHNELTNTADTLTFKFYKNVDCPCYFQVQRDTTTVTLNPEGFTIIHDNLDRESGEPTLTSTDTIIVKNGKIDQATTASKGRYRGQITENLTQDELESFFHKTLNSIRESNPLINVAIEEYKVACSREVHGFFATVKTGHIRSTNKEIENIMLSYLH